MLAALAAMQPGAMKWPSGSPTLSSLRSFMPIQAGSMTRMSRLSNAGHAVQGTRVVAEKPIAQGGDAAAANLPIRGGSTTS